MTEFKSLAKTVSMQSPTGTITWGDAKNFVLFAGPDIIEDEGMVIETGKELKRVTQRLGIPWILKCSFDKANRQSSKSFRGPGMNQALKSLDKIKSELGCAFLTDVHETIQVEETAKYAEVIQIPAFLSRQTDLLVAAAKTGRVIHIKKGQFLAPWDMNDMTGLVDMRNLGFPVIMDCTHSTQLPGATGESSGGRGEMVWPLGRAAMGIGVDGIFLETHPNPEKALCDGPTSLPLKNLEKVLKNLQNIFNTHNLS